MQHRDSPPAARIRKVACLTGEAVRHIARFGEAEQRSITPHKIWPQFARAKRQIRFTVNLAEYLALEHLSREAQHS